ncbi:MAG: biotin/lipoyl-binding protein, partial [Planctomycetaceae bacterium]|nr:biotin/lipoyl-binding protein [Planctomycetaceae bacterium]
MKKGLVALLLAAGLVTGLILSQRPHDRVVVSGFIEADEIRVGSRLGGRVHRVLAEEGQHVIAGTVLVELEPFDLLEKKAEAEQQVAQVRANLDRLEAGFRPEEIAEAKARRDQASAELDKLVHGPRPQEVSVAKAELTLAEAELDLARKVYSRTEGLFGEKAADRNTLDEAATKLSVAEAHAEACRQQLALLEEGSRAEDIAKSRAMLDETEQEVRLRTNGYRTEEIAEAKARLAAAEAGLRALDRQLEELKIQTPVDAVVEAVELQPGDLIGPGVPALSLIAASELNVRAYVPE